MSSINKVILIGRLVADPEIRRMNSGDPVVNIRVATSETWKDSGSGERKERTEYHNVVLFNENHAKFAEQYASKGAMVYVEGQLQTRKWQDQSGQDRYSTEVVLQKFRGEFRLLDKPSEGRSENRSEQRQDRGGQQHNGGRYGAHDDLNDQIPFAPEWR